MASNPRGVGIGGGGEGDEEAMEGSGEDVHGTCSESEELKKQAPIGHGLLLSFLLLLLRFSGKEQERKERRKTRKERQERQERKRQMFLILVICFVESDYV
jgi:hypothetical protein